MNETTPFGGIELTFLPDPIPRRVVKEFSALNRQGGIAVEYQLPFGHVNPESVTALVSKKNGPIQVVTFANPNDGNIEFITEKDCIDFVVQASIDTARGVLILLWNRKQKPRKTLVIVSFTSGG